METTEVTNKTNKNHTSITIPTNDTRPNYDYTETKYQDNTKKDFTPITIIITNRTAHNIEDSSVSSLSDISEDEDEDSLNLQNDDINDNNIDFILTETSTTKQIEQFIKNDISFNCLSDINDNDINFILTETSLTKQIEQFIKNDISLSSLSDNSKDKDTLNFSNDDIDDNDMDYILTEISTPKHIIKNNNSAE